MTLSQGSRPQALSLIPENIPDVLKETHQWVVWGYRATEDDGDVPSLRWTKPPFYSGDSPSVRHASTTNPSTWMTYENALSLHRSSITPRATEQGVWPTLFDGIGFVLARFDGYGIDPHHFVAVDLDHCRERASGTILSWAERIVHLLDSYTEVSPSGTGLRIVCLGNLPPGGRRKGDFEHYQTARYITITGHRLATSPTTIERRHAELLELHRRFWPDLPIERPPRGSTDGREPLPLPPSSVAHGFSGSDDDLLRRAREMIGHAGHQFRRLWNGDFSDYPSHHEADLALCSYLAFWCGPDPQRIGDLFSLSGLYRSKWTREDYRSRTIALALANRKDDDYYHEREPRPIALWPPSPASPSPASPSPASPSPASPTTAGPSPSPAAPAPTTESNPVAPPPSSASPSSASPKVPPQDYLTDLGNAARFVRDQGQDFLYCHPWRSWCHWDGTRWVRDQTGLTVRRFKETVLSWFDRAQLRIDTIRAQLGDLVHRAENGATTDPNGAQAQAMTADLKDAQIAQAWAVKCQATTRINHALELARSDRPITPEQWNQNPWLLNCPNGTVDLRTGILFPHERDQLITHFCPTPYLPAAPCPQWIAFLNSLFDDPDIVLFLQRLLGYSLTGEVSEQILPIFWGTGANGKGTLLDTFAAVMGQDYAIEANEGFLMQHHGDRHSTETASLFGKRLVVASETTADGKLNENRVKNLTGSNPIRCRRMREDFWQFLPTHKIILQTNNKPRIIQGDFAIWRRLKLLQFHRTFANPSDPLPQEGISRFQRDDRLRAKLLTEAQGILSWAVQGTISWLNLGLDLPDSITNDTKLYQDDEDSVSLYLMEVCTILTELRVKSTILYKNFIEWTQRNHLEPLSQNQFGSKLVAKGFQRIHSNGIWYLGLGINCDKNNRDEQRFK